jgi:hypothetical protein
MCCVCDDYPKTFDVWNGHSCQSYGRRSERKEDEKSETPLNVIRSLFLNIWL